MHGIYLGRITNKLYCVVAEYYLPGYWSPGTSRIRGGWRFSTSVQFKFLRVTAV